MSITSSTIPLRRASALGLVASWLELGKARLSSLVVLTTLVGFVVAPAGASGAHKSLLLLCWTLLGTTLSALGANSLNQWLERERDGRMERTKTRPIPSGRLGARHAMWVGLAESAFGVLLLAFAVNLLTALLSLFVILLYVLVYTPLKARSHLNTMVGAVCGAIPPMMGWSAATGALAPGAWLLGAILFAWQIPHFLALAWLYREDYERGGYRMLPLDDPSGRLTGAMATLYSLALVPVALLVTAGGLAGWSFAAGATLLGLGLSALALRLALRRSQGNARALFLASLIYLPLLLGVMVLDRGSATGPDVEIRGTRAAEADLTTKAAALARAAEPRR